MNSGADPHGEAPAAPRPRLCVAVTGHRDDNPAFAAHRQAIESALTGVLACIDAAVGQVAAADRAPTRLHCMLAAGVDQLAATWAIGSGWELVAPLPFGHALNVAINADPANAEETHALLADPEDRMSVCGPATRARALRIVDLARRARCFALADADDALAELLRMKLRQPQDGRLAARFAAETSLRVALAARVMIEQSDLLVAVWDGSSTALAGGTGHTLQAALDAGSPVVWIDAADPRAGWTLLAGPESLAARRPDRPFKPVPDEAALREIVRGCLRPPAEAGDAALAGERLHARSHPLSHAYRRVEALFGADTLGGRLARLRQAYERPEAIATGSAAALLAHAGRLHGLDAGHVERIALTVLRRFAWADGVSARLSDIYRGGMTVSFALAALAIIAGVAYLPWTDSHHKWPFALAELGLLVSVLAITFAGQRRRWHDRWLRTRRVAEYLRHAPILLLFGVTRAPGRWPRATDSPWPEWYARQALRESGLPQLTVTHAYLRQALSGPLLDHVTRQRDYHRAKARRLATVHHNLDRWAETLFVAAVLSVAGYLALKSGGIAGWWSVEQAVTWSYHFTLLGVLLPTLGSALAGIRYFGDFERFAAISRVTAGRLQDVHARLEQLLAAPDAELDYARATDLAHAMDEAVVSEIESWQSVFAGKRVAVPV